MHECPDCGLACDCDGEDLWNDEAARECDHGCDGRDEDDAWEDGYALRLSDDEDYDDA